MPLYPPTSGSGEANTTSNAGAGVALAKTKSGVDLPFKSLVAGAGVTLNDSADEVEVVATGSGEANTTSNAGAGPGELAKAKSGVDLPIKTLEVSGGFLAIDNGADVVTVQWNDPVQRVQAQGSIAVGVTATVLTLPVPEIGCYWQFTYVCHDNQGGADAGSGVYHVHTGRYDTMLVTPYIAATRDDTLYVGAASPSAVISGNDLLFKILWTGGMNDCNYRVVAEYFHDQP